MLIPLSNIYKINGNAIPNPTSYGYDSEDIYSDDSGQRSLDGKAHICVLAKKRIITLKYDALPQVQMQQLLRNFHSATYQLTFLDPEFGVTTMECYTPARKSDLYSSVFYNGLWRNASFECREV